MKFEKDFDFESANAQFNKEEIDREFHNKLKLKGKLKCCFKGIMTVLSPTGKPEPSIDTGSK